ncbi:HNH endonuclease signature motif containing protein [Arthrobacter cavernae]|uniref:HNH endonuclease n=1 Tax=Arthrobacter cavernae TaxID=2817681 RepID=A0A939HA85_9MICC|nr:HNH endonuclease [Arthrobacter cavernae]
MKRGSYGVYRGKYAHRVIYEKLVGPIPKDYVIDHICRVHDCVNPEHLRAITRSQNADANRIKTHCPRGHAYDEKNTYIDGDGGRRCRSCSRLRDRNRRELMHSPGP